MTQISDPAGRAPLPAFASVDDFCRLSGMHRRWVYERMADGSLTARKAGSRTLIDVEAGLRYLHSLPAAKIKVQPSKRTAAADQHVTG